MKLAHFLHHLFPPCHTTPWSVLFCSYPLFPPWNTTHCSMLACFDLLFSSCNTTRCPALICSFRHVIPISVLLWAAPPSIRYHSISCSDLLLPPYHTTLCRTLICSPRQALPLPVLLLVAPLSIRYHHLSDLVLSLSCICICAPTLSLMIGTRSYRWDLGHPSINGIIIAFSATLFGPING